MFVWTRPSSSGIETNHPEIGERQYSLLANPHTLPDDRLEEVRQLLVDDGRISPAEFESLNVEDAEEASAKKLLIKRLTPELIEGMALHPHEETQCFYYESCPREIPRTQSNEIVLHDQTYQVRDIHFCGSKLVSGFRIYRNGTKWNTVKYFGHSHAQVFSHDEFPNLVRTDMSSEEAYRLLLAFYDREISDEEFLCSILDPDQIAAASEGGTPSLQ